jgi:hypothetical protein
MKKIFILSLWCWLSLQLKAREGYIFQQIICTKIKNQLPRSKPIAETV